MDANNQTEQPVESTFTTFDITKLQPGEVEIKEVVAKYTGLKVNSLEDKETIAILKAGKTETQKLRKKIVDTMKAERDGANKYAKAVIEVEKAALAMLTPTEDGIKAELEKVEIWEEMEERKELLPSRKEELKALSIEMTDEDILKMTSEEFLNFVSGKKTEKLEKQEEERKKAIADDVKKITDTTTEESLRNVWEEMEKIYRGEENVPAEIKTAYDSKYKEIQKANEEVLKAEREKELFDLWLVKVYGGYKFGNVACDPNLLADSSVWENLLLSIKGDIEKEKTAIAAKQAEDAEKIRLEGVRKAEADAKAEKERKEKEEKEKQEKEAKEQEKLEKGKKYKKWLADNGAENAKTEHGGEFFVHITDTEAVLYKKVSTFTL